MKTNPRLLLLAGLILALTGCQTLDSRIAEKSSTFATLDPAAQARLKQGIVSVGDTPDMAYIALGEPDKIRVRQTAAGATEVWIYSDTYGYQPEPFFFGTGYGFYRPRLARWPYRDPYFPGYGMYDFGYAGRRYGGRAEERVRISFQAGKAVEVEQPKPKS
ncbi:MAG TPA: hypothetical protein VK641_04065 [Terriglobales bacterium]|nr:hypothetical protein [Terriglobales bacterium]